jgi:hypothetical protein
VAAGGGVESQNVVTFKLHVKVVAVLRFAGDLKEMVFVGGEAIKVNPGHDASGSGDSARLRGDDVAVAAVELAGVRSGAEKAGTRRHATIGAVCCGPNLTFAAGGVQAVEGQRMAGGDGGDKAGSAAKRATERSFIEPFIPTREKSAGEGSEIKVATDVGWVM